MNIQDAMIHVYAGYTVYSPRSQVYARQANGCSPGDIEWIRYTYKRTGKHEIKQIRDENYAVRVREFLANDWRVMNELKINPVKEINQALSALNRCKKKLTANDYKDIANPLRNSMDALGKED